MLNEEGFEKLLAERMKLLKEGNHQFHFTLSLISNIWQCAQCLNKFNMLNSSDAIDYMLGECTPPAKEYQMHVTYIDKGPSPLLEMLVKP